MSIEQNGKNAKSAFLKITQSKNEKFELIAAKLFTGRTHQIRVHLSSINRHILGDNLYGFKGDLNKINRFYLHAYNLYLTHPITKKQMSFKANLPEDICKFLNENFNMENMNDNIDENSIISNFDSFI
jgi:23S rRNA pseudouridine1911/1915/1917 synthase